MGRGEAEGVLQDVFGFQDFRPGQRAAVDAFLGGRDVQVLLPTGGGKSLCFQVPALVRARRGDGPTLVVSPLIALMQDQVEALRARGVRAVALHSQVDRDGWRAQRDELPHADLIYASPERLARRASRRQLAELGLSAVAVDEAHCISEWGHDFRKDYLKLHHLKAELDVPVMALTATATPRVMDEIAASLVLRDPLVVRGRFARDNLRLAVEHIQGHKDRVARAIHWLDHAGVGEAAGRAIVYAATRKRVVEAAKALRSAGIDADHYHAGRSGSARDNAQQRFADGRRSVMVATTAFGMGIDHPDVRLVLHLQAPGSLEAYVQQAGRAGRDGEVAHCVLLYAHADAVTQARLRGATPTPGAEAGWKALQDYAFGRACRQATLERWFGAEAPPDCGTCDACARPADVAQDVGAARDLAASRRQARRQKRAAEDDVTLDAAQLDTIVAFVGALRKPVGKRVIALGLKGSRAKDVRRKGLMSNPHHGALTGAPERVLIEAVEGLLADGRLARKGRKYPTVWLPDKRVRPTRDPSAPAKPRRSRWSTPLTQELANFRTREARRRRWKPYQVFTNATLSAIAEARPRTRAELQAVPGMGPVRVERFGDALLDLVADHG